MAPHTVGRANRLYKPLRQNSIDVLGLQECCRLMRRLLREDPGALARELLPELLFYIIFGLCVTDVTFLLNFSHALMKFTREKASGMHQHQFCAGVYG